MYVLLYPHYPIQLVHGQCFLNIELNQFQNLRSLEIRQDPGGNDNIYCCDDDVPLGQIPELVPTDICDPLCDTFLVVNLEYEDSAPCPVSMITNVTENSATTTDVNYKFCFDLSSSAKESVYESQLMCGQSVLCIYISIY